MGAHEAGLLPVLVWSLLLPAGIRKDFPAMRCALLAGGLLGTWLVPVLFYTYSGILGRNLALIDIGIFYTRCPRSLLGLPGNYGIQSAPKKPARLSCFSAL